MQTTNDMIMGAVSPMTTEQIDSLNNGEMVETSASTLENVLASSPSYVQSQYFRKPKQQVRKHKKIGRNDPCPCGATDENGKPVKYKNCCLKTGKYEGLEDKD